MEWIAWFIACIVQVIIVIKAGYTRPGYGGWALVVGSFLPVIGWIILLVVLIQKWPVQKELEQLKRVQLKP